MHRVAELAREIQADLGADQAGGAGDEEGLAHRRQDVRVITEAGSGTLRARPSRSPGRGTSRPFCPRLKERDR